MNNKLTVQEPIIDKNRLKRSLSQKKQIIQETQPKKQRSPNRQKQIKIQFDVPEVKNLIAQFQKQVSIPIAYHVDVLTSNNLPKCITHNNVMTLYCINDRKPLCVSCLYLSHVHKPHKVFPLTKATQQLKDSLNESTDRIKKNMAQIQKIIKVNEQNLVQTEKQYPLMIEKLHNFYINLHETLVFKKNQQLQQLTQNWSRLRFTYNLRRQQLLKIKQYTTTHLQSLQFNKAEELLLYNRNISCILANIDNIVKQDLCIKQENRFQQDFNKFDSLKTLIDKDLVFTNLFNKQEPLKSSRTIRCITTQQQKKINNRQKLLKLETNKHEGRKDNKQHSITEGSAAVALSARRNRHSKSDLLSKMSVQERKKLKQQSQQKKMHERYRKNLLMKNQKQLFQKQLKQYKTPAKQKKKQII